LGGVTKDTSRTLFSFSAISTYGNFVFKNYNSYAAALFYLQPIELWVILCQLPQSVNPPSQIILKFHKQIELFMLIPKK